MSSRRDFTEPPLSSRRQNSDHPLNSLRDFVQRNEDTGSSNLTLIKNFVKIDGQVIALFGNFKDVLSSNEEKFDEDWNILVSKSDQGDSSSASRNLKVMNFPWRARTNKKQV
jgi:adenine specific DNA methylase Mod